MRILQFSIAFPKKSENIYNVLARRLVKAGHSVKVAVADAALNTQAETQREMESGVDVLRIRTQRLLCQTPLKKGLQFLTLTSKVKRAVRAHYGNEKFDLILFEAPPVTLWKAVAWAKRRFHCPAYLMQKDIFPQNAVDLKMFSKLSPAYLYFRRQEKKMLETADAVGCMSQANIDYICAHNPAVSPQKVEYFPNTMPVSTPPKPALEKSALWEKYGIAPNALVLVFGGNFGRPQNVPLLCRLVRHFKGDKRLHFLFCGSGTESAKLRHCIEENRIANATYKSYVPREEYESLAQFCDAGLITLDPRFTIPNYPSKILSYMNLALPVLAATDTATDFKDLVATHAKCGLWCHSADENALFENVEALLKMTPQERAALGKNGRDYMAQHFHMEGAVKRIEDFWERRQKGGA